MPDSSATVAEPKLTPTRRSSFTALKHRDFRLLWLGQIVSVTGSQMQSVAINWHVYLLTKSALALGLVGLFRGAPIIVCSLVGGVVADAVNRKRLMIATQSVMLATAALLAVATIMGLKSVWPIYVLSAFASAATAFDIPARQSLMPSLVPAADFPNAVSLGLVVFNIATIGGPALAGFVLAGSGPAIIYAINAASFLAVIAALLAMRVTGSPDLQVGRRDALSFTALKEGLQFVWRTPIIVQTMTLDFAATFFASATMLLPIFARERLHVDARGYGFLAAAPAIGSVITALVMARIGTFRREGRLVVVAVAIFGVATAAFGVSRVFWFSLLMLAATGAADTVSTVLRQTIRQLVTPNHIRGRMTAINMMFFMGGPQLGELEAGALAALIGAPLSVVVGGLGSLICACVAAIKSKSLMGYEG
ncbi:MAG TPA: MFS transporter [Pyrinomonadaceae bacterium]|jgi:MFS family permease|nr:MFS transporter [Pyrinomonadaceae bacterium]